MSVGEMVILGGLAFLLVIGTKGKPPEAPQAKAAPPPPRPSAMRWMSRGG